MILTNPTDHPVAIKEVEFEWTSIAGTKTGYVTGGFQNLTALAPNESQQLEAAVGGELGEYLGTSQYRIDALNSTSKQTRVTGIKFSGPSVSLRFDQENQNRLDRIKIILRILE